MKSWIFKFCTLIFFWKKVFAPIIFLEKSLHPLNIFRKKVFAPKFFRQNVNHLKMILGQKVIFVEFSDMGVFNWS